MFHTLLKPHQTVFSPEKTQEIHFRIGIWTHTSKKNTTWTQHLGLLSQTEWFSCVSQGSHKKGKYFQATQQHTPFWKSGLTQTGFEPPTSQIPYFVLPTWNNSGEFVGWCVVLPFGNTHNNFSETADEIVTKLGWKRSLVWWNSRLFMASHPHPPIKRSSSGLKVPKVIEFWSCLGTILDFRKNLNHIIQTA